MRRVPRRSRARLLGAARHDWRRRRLHHRARDHPGVRRADRAVVRGRLAGHGPAIPAAACRAGARSRHPDARRAARSRARARVPRCGSCPSDRDERTASRDATQSPPSPLVGEGWGGGKRHASGGPPPLPLPTRGRGTARRSLGTQGCTRCRTARPSSSPTSSWTRCRSGSSSSARTAGASVWSNSTPRARCVSRSGDKAAHARAASTAPPGAILELRAGEDELLAELVRRTGALRRTLHRLRPGGARLRRHAAGRAPPRLCRSARHARRRRPDRPRPVRRPRRQGAAGGPRRGRSASPRPSSWAPSASPSARRG